MTSLQTHRAQMEAHAGRPVAWFRLQNADVQ
jgi:hypothetical protein